MEVEAIPKPTEAVPQDTTGMKLYHLFMIDYLLILGTWYKNNINY